MQTTNPLIRVPTAGNAESYGNEVPVPLATPLGAQTIAGVQVNPLIVETQTDALRAILDQQLAQQQILADAYDAERLRLQAPKFGNVVGGVQSTEAPLVPVPVEPGPDASFKQMLGDTLLGVATGIPALVEMAGTLGGLVTGNIDNAVTSAGRSGREALQELQSDELKADRLIRAQKVAAAEGEIGKAASYIASSVGDINLFIDAIASNIATGGTAGVAGKLAARGVAKSAARKMAEKVSAGTIGKESSARAAQLIGRKAGMQTAVGFGAVQQGMDVAADVYFDSMADTDWEQNPDYVARLATGEDPDDVKHEMSLDAARMAAPAAIALSAASALVPGGREIDKMFVGRTARDSLRKSGFWARVGGAARGAAGEATQEIIEEGGGAMLGNVAQNVLAAPVALGEGVGEAAGAGAVGGMGLGGIAGLTRAGPPLPRQPATPAAPGATPAAPGTTPPAPAGVVTNDDRVNALNAEAATGEAVSTAENVPPMVPRGVAALDSTERGRAQQRALSVVTAINKALKAASIKQYDDNGLTDVDEQITVEEFLADPNGVAEDMQATGIKGEALQNLNAMALDLNNRTAPAEAEAEMRYALTPRTVEAIRQMSNDQLEAWAAAAGGVVTDPDGNESQRWHAVDILRMISRGEVRPNNAIPADVQAQIDAGFAVVPMPVVEAGPPTEAESAAAALAAFLSKAPVDPAVRAAVNARHVAPVDPLEEPLAGVREPSELDLERNNNELVRVMRQQTRSGANPLTRRPAATSTYSELAEDAQALLDIATANATPQTLDAALTAARLAAEAGPTDAARKFWTDMANDLAGDLMGTRSPRATPATPANPLAGSTPRPKTEAAPAAAGGRQTATATREAQRVESPAERRMRERRERAQSPTIPRPQNTTSAKADNAAINERDDAVQSMFAYDGVRTLPNQRPETAEAIPTGDGTQYVVHIPGQPAFFVEDARAAANALKSQNFTVTSRSITGFVEKLGAPIKPTMEQKASAPIRAAAAGLRFIASPLGVERANNLVNGFLESMASTSNAVMSRYAWIDQLQAGIQATTGEDTRLGRAFRNALQRARSVGTRISSPVFQMRQDIAKFLREVNSDENEFGIYVYALDAIERNPRYAGSKVPGTDLRIDANPAAFDWTAPNGEKLVGTAAAEAFVRSLPADKRRAFEAAYAVTREMVQGALALQWQLGMINDTTYYALGGRLPDGSQIEGARKNWAPLLTEGQEAFSTMETPEGRYTKAANPYINLLRETSRMQRAALMNQPWTELYAALVRNPDASFATLNAQEAKPKDDELVWRRSDVANEKTVWVFFNGERRSITFNDKQAINFIRHARDTERHAVLNGMRTGIQWMAGFRTAWNVAFVLPATAWDALMLGAGVQSASGGTLDKKAAADVTERAFRHLLSSFKTIVATDVTRKANDHYYTVYEINGGGIAFGDRQAFGDVSNRVRSEVGTGNPLWSAVKRVGSTYSDVLHAPEAMFRFSVWKAYIEHKAGHTFDTADGLRAWGREHKNEMEQALEMSRLITADFSDAGLSAGPRSMYMFFNAAMQGTRSLARLAQTPDSRGRQALMVMLMVGAAAALIGAGGEDDEDVDGGSRYARLKGRGRQVHFGEGFAIPLAPEMRMAYTLGNSMALWAMGKISGSKAAFDFGRSAVDTISPLRVPEADMPSDSWLYTFMPSLSHPFLVAILGMDGFGRDTETEEDRTYTYDATGKRVKVESPANYERGRDRDPQWIKNRTRDLYDATGIDLFPGRVAEVGRTVFGGVWSFVDKTESDGVAAATFRGFNTEYDEFAVRHEYDKAMGDAAQELRRLETNVNPLEAATPRVAALKKLAAAEKSLRKIRVNGYDENAIYAMQRKAQATGDENQIAAAESLMLQLRAEKARIMGAAVADVHGQGEL